MSYDVGYKKPPINGQFKKGASGNPKGRPKGSKNTLSILIEELARPTVVIVNGEKKTVTSWHAVIMRLTNGAKQGDMKSIDRLMNLVARAGGFDPEEIVVLPPHDDGLALTAAYKEAVSILDKYQIPSSPLAKAPPLKNE